MDSSSPDETVEIAESRGGKILQIRRDDFNHGGTRNAGVGQEAGDVALFMTKDTVPSAPGCIENLTRALGDTHKGALSGWQLPGKEAAPTEKFARHDNYPDRPLLKSWDVIPQLDVKTLLFSNTCSALRKKV